MTPNRVTTEDLDAAIERIDYDVLRDGRTTICTLTLDNEFTVRGESSCVDPANFDPEVGRRIALQNARDNLWAFLGFRLAEKLHAARQRPAGDLTFGEAIANMKFGNRVTRAGWNGKGQFLELQVPDEHSKMTLPYIFITTVQGGRVPWLASQTDMLANDWMVVA